jgi:hypothetical protein
VNTRSYGRLREPHGGRARGEDSAGDGDGGDDCGGVSAEEEGAFDGPHKIKSRSRKGRKVNGERGQTAETSSLGLR